MLNVCWKVTNDGGGDVRVVGGWLGVGGGVGLGVGRRKWGRWMG